MDIEQLARFLREAAEAHHEYEQTKLNGQRDDDWSEWYAEYILEKMKNQKDGSHS